MPGYLPRAVTPMSEYEFTVSLRIRHPTLDPLTISAALGIEPQHSWRAGEPRRDATGATLGGTHRDSYWMGRLMREPQLSGEGVSVESVLSKTLNQLRRAQPFLEQLSEDGGAAEVLISLFAREVFRIELPPDDLAVLGKLHLTVVLEVHPHSPLTAPPSRSN